jgi:hypothetical protein
VSITICLAANSLYYPDGGGHLWVYLNWALGFRALGCRVIWLEGVGPETEAAELDRYVAQLKSRLAPFGLADDLALWPWSGGELPLERQGSFLPVEAAIDADLLLNQNYAMPVDFVGRFKRTALLDIDPGLTQVWISQGCLNVAPHDHYFTIGETVGKPGARFPDNGLRWLYTPPCVAFDWWPTVSSPEGAPFTTVTHWYMQGPDGRPEWLEVNGESFANDKRAGFLPYLALPQHTAQPLELAVLLGDWEQDERTMLQRQGWRVRDSHAVASTPLSYQQYIQQSRGEFSCVKPSCIRLQNAWISDRTICYLASGKPAVVEHTGPSQFLPDAEGLFRFRDLDQAVRSLDAVMTDYQRHCTLARALAEEYFDARMVAARLLERALG